MFFFFSFFHVVVCFVMICIFVFLTFFFQFLLRVVLYKCRKRVYEYYDVSIPARYYRVDIAQTMMTRMMTLMPFVVRSA